MYWILTLKSWIVFALNKDTAAEGVTSTFVGSHQVTDLKQDWKARIMHDGHVIGHYLWVLVLGPGTAECRGRLMNRQCAEEAGGTLRRQGDVDLSLHRSILVKGALLPLLHIKCLSLVWFYEVLVHYLIDRRWQSSCRWAVVISNSRRGKVVFWCVLNMIAFGGEEHPLTQWERGI